MKFEVNLNGLHSNPFHKLGLTQNPFPQTGKKELDENYLVLQSLGGDPIPDTAHIHKLGLTQNPFPQTGKKELDENYLVLQSLGGDPIPDTAYIRKVLTGWSKEFVDLCCERFTKGVYTTFTVEFPDDGV